MKRRIHHDEFKPVNEIISRMTNAIEINQVIPTQSLKAHAVFI